MSRVSISLALAFGVCGVAGVLPAFAAAPPAYKAAYFFAQGRVQHFAIDNQYVAVAHRPAPAAAIPGGEALAPLGLDLVARTTVSRTDVVVGLPIWFDAAHHVAGVLTNEIVVRVDTGASIMPLKKSRGLASMHETAFKKGLFLAKYASPWDALAAANALTGQAGIRYAHPNFLLPKIFRSRPEGEPYFAKQWHLENSGQFGGSGGADIHVRAAWDITTGAPETIIAVLDGGFELEHPDLDGAWAHNRAEIPGNGIDDDNNGYVDDVLGWNFLSKGPDAGTGILAFHGTATAGLAGARHNGQGVAGVCPNCQLLPLSLAWQASSDAEAFYYAQARGAAVISNSWGYPVGTPTTDVLMEALTTVAKEGRGGKGTLILFAMNNRNIDDCSGAYPDVSSLASVVAVSASSDQDKKVVEAAWGACMDILSPTSETNRAAITTTDQSGKDGYNDGVSPGDLVDRAYTTRFGGTSAATPIAAGVFALMLSVNPALTRAEALAMVEATADKIDPAAAHYDAQTGFSQSHGYGRINAGKAVRAADAFRRYTRIERQGGAARTSE